MNGTDGWLIAHDRGSTPMAIDGSGRAEPRSAPAIEPEPEEEERP
jgi:hypothetical protein